ncbi:MAG TPA: HAD family hydrolase [Chloroflexi bacterium]|jgi:phosphoglycolate phosphatase|nr:HAD family hydrolase [Chloroflexota bacterium]
MLRIAGHPVHAALIILDKDGTLLAFDALWHAWFDAWRQALEARIPMDAPLRQAIAETLGVNPATDTWDPRGPLTLAATAEIGVLLAGLLYRYRGIPWDETLDVVQEAERAARRHIATGDLIQPIGDVRGWLQRLRAAGLRIAIVTTDERAFTELGLARLALTPLIDTMVCGDDGLPLKPAPDAALEVCRRLGVPPEAAIMVGDTVADMAMARRAGLARAVGVASGALSAEALAPHADVVIPDIHAITVAPAGDAHDKDMHP